MWTSSLVSLQAVLTASTAAFQALLPAWRWVRSLRGVQNVAQDWVIRRRLQPAGDPGERDDAHLGLGRPA